VAFLNFTHDTFNPAKNKRVVILKSYYGVFPVLIAKAVFSMFWHPRQEQCERCETRTKWPRI